MTARRGAVLALSLLLSGCGFHPLYDRAGASAASLAAVYVNIIPNRPGQLLRQALQAKLEGPNGAIAKRFTLGVSYSENVQALGVQADNSTTRNRDVGTATWSLHPVNNLSVQVTGGTARSVDGYNIIDEQFFYSDLSQEATERRLADALAEQIVTGLAVYFDRHPDRG